jgi:hypothetical protein
MPRPKSKPGSPAREPDRITYRDLRNTPGRVFERLAGDEPLTLVADGTPRALLIPIPDGDVATAREAYVRGRALLALRRIQDRARREGKARLTPADINRVIREVRQERARADRD